MGDDLGVGVGDEGVAFRTELLLELQEVLDDAVVDNDDVAGGVAVRVRVLLGRLAVRGPAGMPDAVGAVCRLQANGFFQLAELAGGAAEGERAVPGADGDAGGIVAAVLEASQAVNDDRRCVVGSDVADDSAHKDPLLSNGHRVLLDDRIGEHLAGDPVRLLARGVGRDAVS